ncbi:MAG: ATP-binding protein [Saprospiraceae bacterium]|jgi:signal transduction histidine kinase|nr:ATP-binding protein [Saprospiraceae bacterium]
MNASGWKGLFFCLAFVLCKLPWAAGQHNSEALELLDKLRLPNHDSTRIDIHLKLASLYISKQIDAKQGIDHANLALLLAQNLRDAYRQILAFDQLIKAQLELKFDLKSAISLLDSASKLDTASLPPLEKAMLMGHHGKVFLALSDYERSLQLFLKQLHIYESSDFTSGIAAANYNIGSLFLEQLNYQQALDIYQQTLKYYEITNDYKGKMRTLNRIGQVMGQLGDYNKNFSYCSDALLLAKALGDRHELARINANLGYACTHQGERSDALRYYLEAFDVAVESKNKRLEGETAVEIGKIYLDMGRMTDAGTYFETASLAAKSAESKALSKLVSEALCPYYEKMGWKEQAFGCLKELVTLKDEFYQEERAQSTINSQIRYQSETREQELKQLKAKEVESQLTIQKQRMGTYALILGMALLVLLAAFLYSVVRQKRTYNLELENEVHKRTAELEASNQQLLESNKLLEQSNHELERFAYIASHDLKSPLRNVISFLNLIERRLKPIYDPNIAEYLRFASDNARQMHQLIQDVLEFSRVNDDRGSQVPVNMNESLVMVLQNLKDEMEAKNAAVFAGSLPIIDANSIKVLQLMQNLVANGIKYNQSPHPRVLISHREEAERHVFTVKDNGIGIPKEYHELIFGMFKRLHTKDEYPGTGIGLALCRKIVQAEGGDIWLESEEGKGTAIYFTLPKIDSGVKV